MINRFEEFVGTISSIHKNIEKVKKNKMKVFGLSGHHVMCLHYLAQNADGLTAANLCKLIAVDKAATSRVLSELFERGYVCYPNLEGNKKYRAVALLTEEGFAVAKQMDSIIANVVDEIGKSLSAEEREGMYHALAIIENNLNEMTKNM